MGKQRQSGANEIKSTVAQGREGRKRLWRLQQLAFLAITIFLLVTLFRLLKFVLAERSRSPATAPEGPRQPDRIATQQPAPVAATMSKKPPRFVPRQQSGSSQKRVTPTSESATAGPRPRSRRRLGEKVLLASEIVAVLLFVGAAVAFWDTLTEVNDAYRVLQRTDAHVLPTVIPAANPGMAFEALAQRMAAQQEVALLPPFNSVPAPALPTPYPTSTPVVTPVPQATSSPQWGTTVALQKQASQLEQEISRRIEIPSIGVDSFVYQYYGNDWLKLGVVQYGEYVAPGNPGNLVLAAHNDIYGEIFRHLDQLQAGDEVVIFGDRTDFTYRVRETLVVEPTETWVLLPTSKPTLTLISCYPYLLDTQRIVVFADFVQ